MAKFIIQGGNPLHGQVSVSGCKNAALPIMAAAMLSDEPSVITNIPDISDVKIMAEIINNTGAKARQIDTHTWEISGEGINNHIIKPELARKLRASILAVSPIIARLHKATFPHPGGCIIGKRPVSTHLEALKNLGVNFTMDANNYIASVDKLTNSSMFLDEVSVTATENAMMLAAIIPGKTRIRPAACEPHVVDLGKFLIQMGAEITGLGTHELEITGTDTLHGTQNFSTIPDNIEAGTFAIAAIATKGEITIENIIHDDMDPIVHKLRQMGANITLSDNKMTVKYSGDIKPARIQVDSWPRLPSDLQAPFGVLATQANGTSLIHEWMYERRLAYTDELSRMGANITLCDPHRALVTGPSPLFGAKITSPDLRAGITLVIAALIAEGKSEIDHIELIDRGYENLDERMRSLGADIQRVN